LECPFSGQCNCPKNAAMSSNQLIRRLLFCHGATRRTLCNQNIGINHLRGRLFRLCAAALLCCACACTPTALSFARLYPCLTMADDPLDTRRPVSNGAAQ